MDVHDQIIRLLTSFLGDYGKESGGWYSFDCPCCAEEKMVEHDGKYNLEVYVDPDAKGFGGFHCWRCGDYSGMKGVLSTLVKRYGGDSNYEEFRRVRDEYRESRKYSLNFDDDVYEDEDDDIMLPKGFKPLSSEDEKGKAAYDYVIGRGLDDRIIKRFRIGYVADSSDRQLRFRIYFPSYDAFGSLNYWTGRDYTGTNKQKSKNPKKQKTSIVFNESLINWYEPVTLVEGPFDHVVTPNSIPLLGKTLYEDSAVHETLVKRVKCGVRIFLDDDAQKEAIGIYSMLSKTRLRGKVSLISPQSGHDASDIYRERGPKGVLEALTRIRTVSDFDLEFLKWR